MTPVPFLIHIPLILPTRVLECSTGHSPWAMGHCHPFVPSESLQGAGQRKEGTSTENTWGGQQKGLQRLRKRGVITFCNRQCLRLISALIMTATSNFLALPTCSTQKLPYITQLILQTILQRVFCYPHFAHKEPEVLRE